MTSPATWFVGIAWSGDVAAFGGTYDDVTADVLEIPDTFMGFTGWMERIARVGTFNFTLDNGWRNQHGEFGLYTPSNTGGSLYGSLRPMTPMICEVTFNATTTRLFTGYLESLTPDPRSHVCRAHCVDGLEPFTRAKPRFELQTNIRSDELVQLIVRATYTPRPALGYWNLGVPDYSTLGIGSVLAPEDAGLSLETGLQTFEIAGHSWFSGRTSSYQALRDVAVGEWGRLWTHRSGDIIFKNGHWEFLDTTELATISEGMIGVTPLYGAGGIYNRVEVEVTPRKVGSAGTTLGELGMKPKLTPGESKTVEIHFRDPDGGARVTAQSVDTPVYTANAQSDGSGKDKTGSLSVSVDETSTSSIKVTMTSLSSGHDIYVTDLHVTGTPLYIYDAITMAASDADSSLEFTDRTLTIRVALGEDDEFAQSLADYLLDALKDPRQLLTGVRLTNANDALYAVMLERTVGDLIRVQVDTLGIDAPYRIISEGPHHVKGIKHTVEWGLAPHDALFYWVLGLTDFGELDTATILGPL